MKPVIEISEVKKTYHIGEISVQALRGVNLTVHKGEFLSIMGPSGSGKSTLMNLIGCLDEPSSGKYLLDNIDVSSLSRNEYADIRNQKIGFVFQGFNLLPRTTALENVELPLFYDREYRIKDPMKAAEEALDCVGLADRMDHVPNQLSGGQQQRVAIARALVNKPSIILADEPTGNLDTRTSIEIMSVFQELNEQGITILIVTHEDDISHYTKRFVQLRDGKITKDENIEKRLIASEELELIKEEV